jgi:hypothetical protein
VELVDEVQVVENLDVRFAEGSLLPELAQDRRRDALAVFDAPRNALPEARQDPILAAPDEEDLGFGGCAAVDPAVDEVGTERAQG